MAILISPAIGIGYQNTRRLVRLSDGTLYSVYSKSPNGLWQVYVKKSVDNGQTWTGETRISTYAGMDAANQGATSIAVDSDDNLHVVWHGQATGFSKAQIWYNKFNGTSWSGPVRLSDAGGMTGDHQRYPSITVDGSDNVHVVWDGVATDLPNPQIWYSKFTASWSAPVRISTYTDQEDWTQYHAAITVDSSGYVHVVWSGKAAGFGNPQIWYAKYIASWATPVRISTETGTNNEASIAVDSGDNLHVAFVYGGHIYYSKYTTSWSTPLRISTYTGMTDTQNYPSVAVDSNDVVYVAWQGKSTDYPLDFVIWLARYIASWSVELLQEEDGVGLYYPLIRWSRYPSSNIPYSGIDYVFSDITNLYYAEYGAPVFGPPLVTTQLCTAIDHESGTGNGNVTDLGEAAVTQHGHCWSESHNPTTADDKTQNGAKAATGAFTSAITGLAASTLYYVRAYATNTYGTSYGDEVELTTFAAGTPTVTTQECTAVQSDSATGHGTLVDIGDSAVTQHGHVWATDPNPTTADFKTTNGAAGVGVFESSLTGLTPGQTYYVRAYATNTQGTAYGDNVVLECPTGDIPTVTTQACSAITPESATGHGNITSFGDDTRADQHGHCWSTSQNPTLADPHTENGIAGAPGAFTSAITGLLPDTRYYVRAYATNVYGTAYGNQVSIFTYPGGVVINPANPVTVDWADDGVFVDISDDVMEQYIEWGKDRELNEATPSLLALTMDNFDHKYSPPNATSPYNTGANSVRAGHRIRVSFGYPFDDFNDVDGVAIENHAVPKDSQFTWSEEVGTFSIYDNKLRETAGSGGIAVIDFGESDAHIQVDFTKGADNDGVIVFRYSNATNYLYIKATGTQLDVRKVIDGADTQVDAELLAWANGTTKTVKVILHGQYIYVVVDDTLLIKTEHTHNQAETKHGVGGPSIGTAARYEDFGGIYSLFYGTIDRIIPYPNKEKQTALIEASDDLKILERHKLYRRAYSYTGYPGGMRAFIQEVYKNTANVSQLGEIMDIGETIATSPLKSWWGISGLRVCRNVEREENGFFYQDQDSFWNLEAKAHRASAPHNASRCTFYQDYETNNLAFTGLKWESGEEDVFNMISVHVQKSQRDPGNLPVGGQYVWRCAEADVLDGGIGSSLLEIPATSSVIIYFESKDFDCLEDLITPATASNVYKIEGKITGGPFLLAEVVTGSVSGHTGRVLEQAGGYIVLGDCTGAFNVADIWVGATSGATIAIGFKIEGTITNGPFLFGEGITTDVSGDTGIVREVGQDFVLLESCSGVFLAGDTVLGTKSAASLNGTVTITLIGAKTAIPDYQANAAADGSGADKTANLTVVLSYPVYNSYGKGGKLALTNDDTSPIYVTRLLVRGDGYNLQDRGSVYVEDATSKTTYGEHSYDVPAEILTSLAEAKVLADDVKTKEIAPRSKVEITLTNANKEMLTKILSLKLSDRIVVNYSDMGIDESFFINKIIYSILEGGLVVEAVLKLEEVS